MIMKKEQITLPELIQQMRVNVRAYHKVFSDETINKMTPEQLLAYCHPRDRSDYKYQLEKIMKKENLIKSYYPPSDTYEWFDSETRQFFNSNMDLLRDPSEYDPCSEGYTPFGDD